MNLEMVFSCFSRTGSDVARDSLVLDRTSLVAGTDVPKSQKNCVRTALVLDRTPLVAGTDVARDSLVRGGTLRTRAGGNFAGNGIGRRKKGDGFAAAQRLRGVAKCQEAGHPAPPIALE